MTLHNLSRVILVGMCPLAEFAQKPAQFGILKESDANERHLGYNLSYTNRVSLKVGNIAWSLTGKLEEARSDILPPAAVA